MTHTLSLASDTKNLAVLEAFLTQSLQGHAMDETCYHNAVVVLTEAVNNAINHGNRRDPAKMVDISIGIEDNFLIIRVQDEGEGFDESAIPDPLHPDNLLREGGRGVFLIRAFSDKVEFRNLNKGTLTTIHLKMQPDAS